jgi:hypothetical protein
MSHMALPVMCFSWVKPIEVFCVKQGEAKTSRKRFYRIKTGRKYNHKILYCQDDFYTIFRQFSCGFYNKMLFSRAWNLDEKKRGFKNPRQMRIS